MQKKGTVLVFLLNIYLQWFSLYGKDRNISVGKYLINLQQT